MNKPTLREKIVSRLDSIDRDWKWLAKKADINYNTFFYTMKHENAVFPQDRIDKINKALKTKFKA